ncbi:MAG: NAD(P)-dependent oxidoreductase [Cytophagaceae bacterium]|jgi:alanine dehydrogenase|nr:NAD(P)-dependent oxidoreductase [Cytophagaceae bacterium]
MKIGILRESKVPVDWRVPLHPQQCADVMKVFPEVEFFIQPSDTRCFRNQEYVKQGLTLQEDLSDCDLLLGIKEIAEHLLIPSKRYMFFSHTIKKQPHNKKLLQAILERRIEMIDYECIKDQSGQRLIAFGRFAGIVGAYNSMRLYGEKYRLFELKPAYKCFNLEELKHELQKIRIPAIRIVVTGTGRVGNGICEMLDFMRIPKIDAREFLKSKRQHAVYTQLSSADYHSRKAGSGFSSEEFHAHPEKYKSDFLPYTEVSDMLITGAFWHPQAPVLFSKADMKRESFKIKLIGDVTCDFNGSVPCTIKPTTIYDPAYDYNPTSEGIEPPFGDARNITVMAIENLPGELPRDASTYFGEMMMKNVLPYLLGKDQHGIIERATIAREGKLTPPYQYLQTWVSA